MNDSLNINIPPHSIMLANNSSPSTQQTTAPATSNLSNGINAANAAASATAANNATNPPSTNDLLKYSYSYPTNQNYASLHQQQTKLPSISTLLSTSSTSNNSSSPSSPNTTTGKNPPLLRHNTSVNANAINIGLNNARSESFSSIDGGSYSRSNSLLNQSHHSAYSSSLETLTNVAQQSFGSINIPNNIPNNIIQKNSFSNSQYFSSNHPSYMDYSIPKYNNLSSSLPTSSSVNAPSSLSSSLSSSSSALSHKYSLSYSQNSDDNASSSSPSSPTSSLSTSAPNSAHNLDTLDHNGNSLTKSKKKRSNLPKQSTSILLSWLNNNLDHPYPNSKEKIDLMRKTGLTAQQLSNWFINARRRKIQVLRVVKR